jgi:hypothetical protein
MDTATKGRSAESAFLHAFIERGYAVSVPFGGSQPYDLVVEPAPGHLLRVQCKTARPSRNGCIDFNCYTTDHGRGRLSYRGLADLFGVRLVSTERLFLVPVTRTAAFSGRLRVEPPRNNQQRGVRMAADFELEGWTTESLCRLCSDRTRAHA